MNELPELCRRIVTSVEGALACALVDLRSGMTLAVHGQGADSQELSEALAKSAMEMFRSEAASHGACVDEVQLRLGRSRHFGKRLSNERALVLVTIREANAGMSLAQLKESALLLEP